MVFINADLTTRPVITFNLPGTGPIFLDDVACNGTERSLLNCSHDGININDCFHSEDIAVECPSSNNYKHIHDNISPSNDHKYFCICRLY